MKRFSAATLLAFAILALGSGVSLLAHEGHEHKVMGTVTMAAADHLMLKDKDGKDVTVKVTKDTKVKAKPAIKVEEIKVGTRVVITAVEEKDKSMTAKNIEVGAAPPPPSNPVFQTGACRTPVRASDLRVLLVPRRTTDQICGRRLMQVKRGAPISCRHRCRRKEPLPSDQRSGRVDRRCSTPILRAGRDNFRDNLRQSSVPVTRSLSYT